MNDLRGEKLVKFQQHRDAILNFIQGKASPFLQQVKEALPREEEYRLPEEKLAKSEFTLALVGAFQSGKSTLFNYLCDGREYSPVGPGGGGIRTSGCRVAAHSLAATGEKEEYAIVSWRTAKDLLDSFGDVLRAEYGESFAQLNLDDAACRRELENKAWGKLHDFKGNDDDRELLRFALLVAHFYPEYTEKCRNGAQRLTPDEAVHISSYPQEWDQLWDQVRESNGSMKVFDKKQVAFAFCGGVDLYLDSANLQELGCSIVDCPGLFASKWDTQIAEECIGQANAILYMFRGDQDMRLEDLGALRNCVKLGGKHKLLFGANLRISRKEWKGILEKAIIPKLKGEGFEKPEVHEFHSALALRARELFLLDWNSLSAVSRSAIEFDMKQDGDYESYEDKDVAEFLKKKLRKFVRILTDKEDVEIEEAADFEKESGAEAFLQAANNEVAARRGHSILVKEGSSLVHFALDSARSDMSTLTESLKMTAEEAQEEWEKADAVLRRFNEKRKHRFASLEESIKLANISIEDKYNRKLEEILKNKENAFISIIEKNMVSFVGAVRENFDQWGEDERDKKVRELTGRMTLKEQRLHQYKRDMDQAYRELSNELLAVLQKELDNDAEIRKVRERFENHRTELMEDVGKLKDMPNLEALVPFFPDTLSENISSMVWKDFSTVLLEEERSTGEWWVDFLTAGLASIWSTDRARAEKAYKEKMAPKLKDCMKNQLKEAMNREAYKNRPAGPLQRLKDLAKEFKEAFDEPIRQHEARAKEKQKMLKDSQELRDQKLKTLSPLRTQVEALLKECSHLEACILSDFPAER